MAIGRLIGNSLMAGSSVDALAGVLKPALDQLLMPKRPRRGAELGFGRDFGAETKKLARELAAQAATAKIPFSDQTFQLEPLSGGNTAETVAILAVTSRFVLKADRADAKLAREAQVMRKIRDDPANRKRFRDAVPIVYAVRDTAPYAYLMQYFPKGDGWVSLEDRLYPGEDAGHVVQADANRWMDAALDILFDGYTSRQDVRRPPDVNVDYVGRIRERLTRVAEINEQFASRPLIVNRVPVLAWERYLDLLDANADRLRSLGPPFSTVVHGDPNPGNIMLRTDVSSIEVKLIDPKDWGEGDYLFDIAKITHFLTATGPIEKPASGEPVVATLTDDADIAQLDYRVDAPAWTGALVDACCQRARQFAETYGDKQWMARYELGMAANILGLPDGRLKKGRTDAALALYGEGLLWLDRFCRRLGDHEHRNHRKVSMSNPADIEPRSLAVARALVRQRVPDVRSTQDRRGFQLLHWTPPRSNDQGKPAELSLEHEGRLSPLTPAAAGLLRNALAHATTQRRRVGEALLPNHERFGEMEIERLPRDTGPQSVDRYWDVVSDGNLANGLIARHLSFRERVRTSSFMTWSSGDTEQRAINLELPVVALGLSGVVARLEFNWIDVPKMAWAALYTVDESIVAGEPVAITAHLHDLPQVPYGPIIEHTTFREKFVVHAEHDEHFHLNIDHIAAQSLSNGRIASYVDIDIAAARLVDTATLAELVAFVDALRSRYDLTASPVSKAWRDAEVLGLLAD